jgi:chromosome segregation protein
VYLRRLELSGFKTFADRTRLEFGPGLSAIVGPNGSGKSNIADAIIWCLGEQSLKSVRSAHSHDVIFAGSESRRRAGLAEVTITLDNSDGTLPLDFAEVQITRRVFRTGEGEYFINRVPCRLRDIHELLLDTGIGKHAYSVISQNEIDRILSVRSEDRREIFEQAAGIQRYRQRKNEATRKLEKVCANLLRVNDILHELESQLAPLAQQSEAAREYRRVTKELFDLKLSLLVHERQVLSENLSRARDREAELEREMEAARTRGHQLSGQEAELRARLQEVEGRLDEARGLVARITREVDRAEGRLGLTRQRMEELGRQALAVRDELPRLEGQLAAAEEELSQAEQQGPELAEQARSLRAEIAAHEERLRAETGLLRSAGDSAEQQRAEHLELLRELADARNRQVQCESLLQAARARIARLQEQRAGLAAHRAQVEARAAAAAQSASELRQRRGSLQAEIYSLDSEREASAARAADLSREELRLRERLSAARSRHRALEEIERSREGLRAGVKAVLAAAEAGQLQGQYSTVVELLQVPGELELAVEAALGPAAGDLVVPSQAQAAAAIALLKETQGGRATFLLHSSLRPTPRPAGLAQLVQSRGCLGIAADLVSCRPGGEAVAEHLLGRVLVVDTLDTALRLSRDSQGWRAIVTLDGDAVRPWGAITGGSRPAGPQLMGRVREIEELQLEEDKLEAALAAVADDMRRAQEEAEASRASAEARQAESDELATALAEAERLAEVLAENARGEAEREQALAAEQTALEEEIGQNQRELAAAKDQVQEVEQRQRAAEAAMQEVESAVRAGRDAREELSQATSELRLGLTSMEGDLRALEARLEKLRESRELLRAGIEERRALLARLGQAQEEAETSLRQAQAECERLKDHHRKAEQELAASQGERQHYLDQIAANLEAAAGNREELEALQGRLHRSQLRTTQLDSEISFTERALLDEFRISLEEAEQKAGAIESRTSAKEQVARLQAQRDALGEVNLGAVEEYQRVRERVEFLTTQRADLEAAREDLQQAIVQIDREATTRFLSAFEALQREFRELFVRLFGGGHADLTLTQGDNVLECGVEVTVTVPGKKTRDLLQLSGGERALTAAAILFALLKVKPSPFVILDEVDASLDDSNVGRYCEVLHEFAQESQFVIITHNKGTMEATDVLYGVTMEEPGVSKLIGVRLRDAVQQEEPGEEVGERSQQEPSAAGVLPVE